MSTLNENIILLTDSYKVSHWKQYPPATTRIFSFFESRGGTFPAVTFFGLQYYLDRYLSGPVVTEEAIEEARPFWAAHFGSEAIFHEHGWRHILEHHDGCLPILIRAIPEGTTVPVSNALLTVENTDPTVPWITNYVETLLSQLWYPCTVATQSREMRKMIQRALDKSGDPSLVPFKLHDFGFRGSTSVESAGIGAAAHLVSFRGTDTVQGLVVARRHYGEPMAGFSIPAAEHSTITSWGRSREVEAYRHMLTSFPSGLVAVVSDSYDIFTACREMWGQTLREHVLERNGTLVVRPDSGNPPEVVVEVLNILSQAFGFTVNTKGYKVLDPHVRVIQGDGIDFAMMRTILSTMMAAGFSADNIAFGSGGGLLQKMDRDTQKFAFKCSAAEVDGTWIDVIKDPITDPGKRSKAGRLALVKNGQGYRTINVRNEKITNNELRPVFQNGQVLHRTTFADVRRRALMD